MELRLEAEEGELRLEMNSMPKLSKGEVEEEVGPSVQMSLKAEEVQTQEEEAAVQQELVLMKLEEAVVEEERMVSALRLMEAEAEEVPLQSAELPLMMAFAMLAKEVVSCLSGEEAAWTLPVVSLCADCWRRLEVV